MSVIATEMSYNLEGAIWRMRTINCVEQRLDTLAKILDDASRSGSLPPVGYIWQSPRHMWRSGAWESVVAAETATHFPRQQLAGLASLYQLVERMESYSQLNLETWGNVYALVGPGRRLDPASEAELRKALSVARATNHTSVVYNRPGAGGTIAVEQVANAAPDGYTLVMADPSGSLPANVTLYPASRFHPIRNRTPGSPACNGGRPSPALNPSTGSMR